MRLSLLSVLSVIVLGYPQSASAVISFSSGGNDTYGSFSFDDTSSGGYLEVVVAPAPSPGLLPFPSIFSYTSIAPHVDSAALNFDLNDAAGIPYFSATGSLTQFASGLGTVASFGAGFGTTLTGVVPFTPVIPALTLMGLNVGGTVGSVLGSFVSFHMEQEYRTNPPSGPYDLIGTLTWDYVNATPSAIISGTIIPTWTPGPIPYGSLLLPSDLKIFGTILVKADPSAIFFGPASVPEPSTALLCLGAGVFLRRRREAAL